jgi:hypothetical protein
VKSRCLSGLEVVEEDLESGGVLSVVGDNDTRASDDLSGLALSVDLLRGCQLDAYTRVSDSLQQDQPTVRGPWRQRP